jgi:uncharacterized membrane protein YuzA (DUF378 family)
MNSTVSGTILIVAGLLAMIGSALNWRFLSRRKLFNFLFGETVSRIIYFVVGLLLFIIGVGRLIGADWLKL